MEAPIKETLAAAIIDLGRIYPDTLAQDPFCGSGTLMIEAAMKAMNMAPACGAALRRSTMRFCLPPSGKSSGRKPFRRSGGAWNSKA